MLQLLMKKIIDFSEFYASRSLLIALYIKILRKNIIYKKYKYNEFNR